MSTKTLDGLVLVLVEQARAPVRWRSRAPAREGTCWPAGSGGISPAPGSGCFRRSNDAPNPSGEPSPRAARLSRYDPCAVLLCRLSTHCYPCAACRRIAILARLSKAKRRKGGVTPKSLYRGLKTRLYELRGTGLFSPFRLRMFGTRMHRATQMSTGIHAWSGLSRMVSKWPLKCRSGSTKGDRYMTYPASTCIGWPAVSSAGGLPMPPPCSNATVTCGTSGHPGRGIARRCSRPETWKLTVLKLDASDWQRNTDAGLPCGESRRNALESHMFQRVPQGSGNECRKLCLTSAASKSRNMPGSLDTDRVCLPRYATQLLAGAGTPLHWRSGDARLEEWGIWPALRESPPRRPILPGTALCVHGHTRLPLPGNARPRASQARTGHDPSPVWYVPHVVCGSRESMPWPMPSHGNLAIPPMSPPRIVHAHSRQTAQVLLAVRRARLQFATISQRLLPCHAALVYPGGEGT
jgi:hypothetical protein